MLNGADAYAMAERVNYYCKLACGIRLNRDAGPLSLLKLGRKRTVYYFDAHELARYFPKHLRWNTEFGDVNYYIPVPSITKSRPIAGDNSNSVLLKLNKVRHFQFVSDTAPFRQKEDKLVFRGACCQPHRRRFLEQYFGHPLCDVGEFRRQKKFSSPWSVPPLSISEHLRYKFILSLEGNDVASNLKWIMSSNSIAVMPRPKFETWFMEGTLIPGVHYIEINDDYSDLEEKLTYYLGNLQAAEKIIANAHRHVDRFRDLSIERMIGIMTLRKYFSRTGQINISQSEEAIYSKALVDCAASMPAKTVLDSPQMLFRNDLNTGKNHRSTVSGGVFEEKIDPLGKALGIIRRTECELPKGLCDHE